MEERDYRTYIELFNNMANFMRKPNLIIHLDVSPQESIERIKRRGRDMEKTISVEYLTHLYNAYEEFIKEISHIIPVIKVNWSEFRDPEEMATMIKEEWEKMQNIRVVDFSKPTNVV